MYSKIMNRVKETLNRLLRSGRKNAADASQGKESIRFRNFRIREGRIDFCCVHTRGKSVVKENQVYFELSKPIIPSNDAIVLACACMCGSAYETIRIDLPCSDGMRENLEKFTGSKVVTRPGGPADEIRPIRSDKPVVLLNFSGGTDSLAALSLLPRENVKLVSTDFGGWFECEKAGYELHRPDYILKTNLRSLDYHRNSWTFMGIGMVLFIEHAQTPYFCFGTNLTDSLYHLMKEPPLTKSAPILPFSTLGAKQICLTNGIGSPAIIRIASYYHPDIMQTVFDSLAMPGSKKRYYKELMLEVVKKRFSADIAVERTAMEQTCSFGEVSETDLQLPYVIKHLGREPLECFVSDIPQEIYEISEKYELTFYERMYPVFLKAVPDELRDIYLARLNEAGIELYTQRDYEELAVLSDFAWNRYRK